VVAGSRSRSRDASRGGWRVESLVRNPASAVLRSHRRDTLVIGDTSDADPARRHLDLHNNGQTSYLEMSQGLAASGVDKWTVDAQRVTFTCVDKHGNELLAEAVE
jgi:uncharacterized protein YbcV (DUF1398 family)